ncbi:hypothetical protein M514_26472 [Trichuris suis]|uniref:ISXO2-like transposase domain-containing protein n=1 Tax=Trichuris suis TaxID=68888 RepID=A0A085MVU3_9BILA|nr:hypothetical protein M514_26472 [Trichuris suis]
MKFCEDELGINKSVRARWDSHLLQVIAEALTEAPVQHGGPSRIVELDESLFSRSKYNRGKRYPQQWVFGGTCRETGDAFVVPVEDRSSQTPLPIIQRHFRAGTTVITDEWHAFRCLSREAYVHLRVNHSVNYVDRSTGAHTQSVESLWAQAKRGNKRRNPLWAQAKRGNKRRCGTRRCALPLHLCEFASSKLLAISDDAFDAILADILRGSWSWVQLLLTQVE